MFHSIRCGEGFREVSTVRALCVEKGLVTTRSSVRFARCGFIRDVVVVKENLDFSCKKCRNQEKVMRGKKNVSLEQDVELECVDEFCYLGDMLGAGSGAGEASRVRVRCAWKKFMELS